MEKKLQVRGLTISFRTSNGRVHAVRDIDFDLYKGETLAIVGESGSGKSVTSKAILGILAGNSIIEGGEIIYDGKDLLKITEEDFHKIRGDKIAMIFQDPMSALNPIVRIGKQLTEAMILKGKARQRENRNNLDSMLKNLEKAMESAVAKDDPAKTAEIRTMCKNFRAFESQHIKLESAYNVAHEAAEEAVEEIDALVFELEKKAAKDVSYRTSQIAAFAKHSVHEFVVSDRKDEVLRLAGELKGFTKKKYGEDLPELRERLTKIAEIEKEALQLIEPDFMAMGYCQTFSKEALPTGKSIAELNAYMEEKMNREFMDTFRSYTKQALQWSAQKAYEGKAASIEALKAGRETFVKKPLVKSACLAETKRMGDVVDTAIDHLEIVKDSLAYTFQPGMKSDTEKYFSSITKNAKEEKRYARESERYNRKVARGKTLDYVVVPAAITDPDMVQDNLVHQIDRLVEHFGEAIDSQSTRDYDAETEKMVQYLQHSASGAVLHVTKRMAKSRAIKLMSEVGIAEPRKRYTQYPFEFSGGMRQRIVIAIALAADPDILICDEPTTALDVTIQSQILELINDLKAKRNLSIIFITHDLGVVANMSDRIAVMYAGKIVEYGTSEDVFYHSAHPYTWALLSSMPDLDVKEKLDAIPGTPPDMLYPPKGDAFAARNKYAMQIDFEEQPPMFKITDTHYAATWLLHPNAPKIDPPKSITDRIARMEAKRGGKVNGEE